MMDLHIGGDSKASSPVTPSDNLTQSVVHKLNRIAEVILGGECGNGHQEEKAKDVETQAQKAHEERPAQEEIEDIHRYGRNYSPNPFKYRKGCGAKRREEIIDVQTIPPSRS